MYIQATEVGGTHPALVEAMGRGAAIIANDVPEHREVLAEAGLYYARNDPDDLARLMLELMQNAAMRASLGHKAHALALARYSWDHITDEYERLFQALVSPIS
jgi:glycosyltransferase involved in cell wall biosynthesis